MTDLAAIELEQFLPHPPERVWRALTDSKLVERWLMPNDLQPRVGHRFTFDTGTWGTTDCEVLDVEDNRLLRIAWRNHPLDTILTWTLEPERDGTRLRMVHEGFDLDDPAQRAALDGMSSGWPTIVAERLPHVLTEEAEHDAR